MRTSPQDSWQRGNWLSSEWDGAREHARWISPPLYNSQALWVSLLSQEAHPSLLHIISSEASHQDPPHPTQGKRLMLGQGYKRWRTLGKKRACVPPSRKYLWPHRAKGRKFEICYFKSWKMMLWKCCTQYASKFGKLSSGHRTGKGQFSSQSQRKAMPKNAQTNYLALST